MIYISTTSRSACAAAAAEGLVTHSCRSPPESDSGNSASTLRKLGPPAPGGPPPRGELADQRPHCGPPFRVVRPGIGTWRARASDRQSWITLWAAMLKFPNSRNSAGAEARLRLLRFARSSVGWGGAGATLSDRLDPPVTRLRRSRPRSRPRCEGAGWIDELLTERASPAAHSSPPFPLGTPGEPRRGSVRRTGGAGAAHAKTSHSRRGRCTRPS